MPTCKYLTLLMRYYISQWKGQKMGGVFQPAVLQSVQEMLFFWLAPLFVGWGGRGHVAGMHYPAIREKTESCLQILEALKTAERMQPGRKS